MKKSIELRMLYLSGPHICDISCKFGLSVIYPRSGGAKSRWDYFKDLIIYCSEKGKVSQLIEHLFKKSNFCRILSSYLITLIDKIYDKTIDEVIYKINTQLYFSGYELSYLGNEFIINKVCDRVTINSPAIKILIGII